MEKYIDLHTHSTCSDGTFTPEEIIKKAYELGLAAVAITDHDTLSGVKEAIEAGKNTE
ncbi:MAG: PHP domain-containing protein [Clostridiales bacterium]|nr:PHP domain-containing protein [Clostridiales bacterium]